MTLFNNTDFAFISRAKWFNIQKKVSIAKFSIFFLDLLINQGKSCLLSWLQQVLLDACYAKLSGSNIQTPDGELLEPVPHYYNSKSLTC
jgi:hypothetical protein